jgi:hypothetical protein
MGIANAHPTQDGRRAEPSLDVRPRMYWRLESEECWSRWVKSPAAFSFVGVVCVQSLLAPENSVPCLLG